MYRTKTQIHSLRFPQTPDLYSHAPSLWSVFPEVADWLFSPKVNPFLPSVAGECCPLVVRS